MLILSETFFRHRNRRYVCYVSRMEKNARYYGRPGKTGKNTIRCRCINYYHVGHGHRELLHRKIQSVSGHTNILLILRYYNNSDNILYDFYSFLIFKNANFRIRRLLHIRVALDILLCVHGYHRICRIQQPSFHHVHES